MKEKNGYLSIKEALEVLAAGNVNWSEGYFRNLICQRKVKSEKRYTLTVVSKAEIARIIGAKRQYQGQK